MPEPITNELAIQCGSTHSHTAITGSIHKGIDQSIAKTVVEEGGRRDRFDGEAQRAEGRRVFELERVVSCRRADPWWRTKLDFGSGESLDDLHRSTAFRAAPKIGTVFGGSRVVRLAAVVPNPTTESKAVGAWRVCGWPKSRSYGCARSLLKECAVRSGMSAMKAMRSKKPGDALGTDVLTSTFSVARECQD
jgi:hypothetical protein